MGCCDIIVDGREDGTGGSAGGGGRPDGIVSGRFAVTARQY